MRNNSPNAPFYYIPFSQQKFPLESQLSTDLAIILMKTSDRSTLLEIPSSRSDESFDWKSLRYAMQNRDDVWIRTDTLSREPN